MEKRKKGSSRLNPVKATKEAEEIVQSLLDDRIPTSDVVAGFQRTHPAGAARASVLRAIAQELRRQSVKPAVERMSEFLIGTGELGHSNTLNPALGAALEAAVSLGPDIGTDMAVRVLRQRLFLGVAGRLDLPLADWDKSLGTFFRTQMDSAAVLLRLMAQASAERPLASDFLAAWCILLRLWLTGRNNTGPEQGARANMLLQALCNLDTSLVSDDLKFLFPRLIALAGADSVQTIRDSVVIRELISQRFLILPSDPKPHLPVLDRVLSPESHGTPHPPVTTPDPLEDLGEQERSLIQTLVTHLREWHVREADLQQRLRQKENHLQSQKRDTESQLKELKRSAQEAEDTNSRLMTQLREAGKELGIKTQECEALKKTVADWKREAERSEHGIQGEQGRLQEEFNKTVRTQLLKPAEDVKEHIVQQLTTADQTSPWHRLAVSYDRLYRRIVRIADSQYVEWLPRREEQPPQ
jgi:hypothetical protein